MVKADEARFSCPACGSSDTVLFCSAVVSPWVSQLARERNPSALEIRECDICATVFSDCGYSPKVMAALYKKYRGEEYQNIRQCWEPGYTKELNSALNGSSRWMELRQQDILKSISKAGINSATIETCVDYGGGHGGVMPNFLKRFVFEENSQVRERENLKILRHWSEVGELRPDLVMCCGVLEHVNNPKELINQIKTSGAKYYYFEVPAGRPARRVGIFASKIVLELIARSNLLWRVIQTFERNFGDKKLRKYFPFRISEHLQFFSETGLQKLIENSGLKVMHVSTQDHSAGLAGSKNMAFGRTIGVVACA
jgi:hypothetical protein